MTANEVFLVTIALKSSNGMNTCKTTKGNDIPSIHMQDKSIGAPISELEILRRRNRSLHVKTVFNGR